MISPRRTRGVVALLTVACVGLIIRHGHSGRPVSAPVGDHHPAALTIGNLTSPDIVRPDRARDPGLALQQGSLRGTVADGNVNAGFGGHLAPDLSLRRLFDYYLALNGETDFPGIRGLLQRDLVHRRLAAPVAHEVMQTFDNYVRYQQAAANLANRPGVSLEAQLTELQTLQQQILGENVAQAFYGAERAQQVLLLQRLAVRSNHEMSPMEKSRRLQALDAAVPAPEREARAQASVGHLVQQQTALLDEAQADPATRHAERAEVWGDSVADRLAQLDQQRAQWQARLDVYSTQREGILKNDELDTNARQTALQNLLQTSFHGTEQLQVRAMASSGVLATVSR